MKLGLDQKYSFTSVESNKFKSVWKKRAVEFCFDQGLNLEDA